METSIRYRCENQVRAQKLRTATDADEVLFAINGIDHLEVLDRDMPPPEPPQNKLRQRTLLVHLFRAIEDPSPNFNTMVVVVGGVRTPVQVEWAHAANDLTSLPPGTISVPEKSYYEGLPEHHRILVVRTNSEGDFSSYLLRIQTSGTEEAPPEGFDPVLSEVKFSFKVECPNEFDCQLEERCVDVVPPPPNIDYLAKDYNSFRQLMLDRLSVTNPQWRERHLPDLQLTLVELLAYAGDRLSYFQDGVATEAYLNTARRRTSVRRHARLLDYPMHDGCNARAWLHLGVERGVGGLVVDPGAEDLAIAAEPIRFLSDVPGAMPTITSVDFIKLVGEQPSRTVFELRSAVVLNAAHNEIAFHTWGAPECCLPKGATDATLVHRSGMSPAVGEFLLLEEVRGTGEDPQPDPSHRQVVRITKVDDVIIDAVYGVETQRVSWDDKDALSFALCLSYVKKDGTPEVNVSFARGNMVLADHGRTIGPESLEAYALHRQRPYRPSLDERGITCWHACGKSRAEITNMTAEEQEDYRRTHPASAVLLRDPKEAIPAIQLRGEGKDWTPRRDLLGSDRFDTHFVAETESDGIVRLCFGDDVYGLQPKGDAFTQDEIHPAVPPVGAMYRIGNGTVGNLGADSIKHIVTALAGITEVYQPLPAQGGIDPESLEEVRQYAPQAFRVQERAVTEEDYAIKAQQYPDVNYPDVQRAAATRRWTGSWYTMFVTADRMNGGPVDEPFEEGLRSHLEKYRLTGHDLEVDAPQLVPLDIRMSVCVKPDHFAGNVKKRLLEVFGSSTSSNEKGFFHPDNFTFGQSVYLSQLLAKAMSVDGVKWVDILSTDYDHRFQRWGRAAGDEIQEGRIPMGRLEIAQLDNDPSRPENGRLEFYMH